VLKNRQHRDNIAFDGWKGIWKHTWIEYVAGTFPYFLESRIDPISVADPILPVVEHCAIGTTYVDDNVSPSHECTGPGNAHVA